MTRLIQWFKDLFRLQTFGSLRSPAWPRVRAEHLKENPFCIVTGSTKNPEVHHLLPVHKFPSLELDPKNLITLSRNSMGCNIHLLFGHLGDYKNYNLSVWDDAIAFNKRIISNKLNQHD